MCCRSDMSVEPETVIIPKGLVAGQPTNQLYKSLWEDHGVSEGQKYQMIMFNLHEIYLIYVNIMSENFLMKMCLVLKVTFGLWQCKRNWIHDNDVCNLVDFPDDFNQIGCKWIFKTTGIQKVKLRNSKPGSFAKEFNQRRGIHFNDTFYHVFS